MASYTPEEVATHNTEDDCWIIANGIVYDATGFVHKHPGGRFAILSKAGTDVTDQYRWHSRRAKRLWKARTIGTVPMDKRCCAIS